MGGQTRLTQNRTFVILQKTGERQNSLLKILHSVNLPEKLTLKQHEITREDVQRLKNHGFDDRAVHDIAQVVSYFNYITRIADGLGVEQESFIQEWEL